MRVILLGPPGSGKGTQGGLVEHAYGFPLISTGNLLRDAVKARTELGLKAESLMNRGELVNDEIVLELVRERIFREDCRRGYILDGFPRNLAQADSLEAMNGGRPEVAIEIDIDTDKLMQRLVRRRMCSKCELIFNLEERKPSRDGICDACGSTLFQRDDDKPEVILERLRVYREKTEPLVAYYQGKNVYHRVDGSLAADAVFEAIRKIIDGEMSKIEGARSQG